MSSHLAMALEAQKEAQEIEIEYSYFLLLNQEQLKSILEGDNIDRSIIFSESKLSISTRIRHYLEKDGSHEYELTTKKKLEEHKGKLEENNSIGELSYEALLATAKSTVIRVRVFMPLLVDGKEVERKDGSPLTWELDLYIDGRNAGDSVQGFHPWAKVELEVDKATLKDVVEYIPFEYEELIHSDSQDTLERAHIGNLYDNEYDVNGKFEKVDLSTILSR